MPADADRYHKEAERARRLAKLARVVGAHEFAQRWEWIAQDYSNLASLAEMVARPTNARHSN